MDEDRGPEDPPQPAGLTQALDLLAEQVEAFLAISWAAAAEHEVTEAIRRVESLKSRFDAATDLLIVSAGDAPSPPGTHLARSPAALQSAMLRLSGPDAARWVRHARLTGPRVNLTGHVLP